MLVLSRKRSETIKIGDDIELVVVEIRGNTVRLGLDAPKEVLILRGELTPREKEQPSEEADAVSAQ